MPLNRDINVCNARTFHVSQLPSNCVAALIERPPHDLAPIPGEPEASLVMGKARIRVATRAHIPFWRDLDGFCSPPPQCWPPGAGAPMVPSRLAPTALPGRLQLASETFSGIAQICSTFSSP